MLNVRVECISKKCLKERGLLENCLTNLEILEKELVPLMNLELDSLKPFDDVAIEKVFLTSKDGVKFNIDLSMPKIRCMLSIHYSDYEDYESIRDLSLLFISSPNVNFTTMNPKGCTFKNPNDVYKVKLDLTPSFINTPSFYQYYVRASDKDSAIREVCDISQLPYHKKYFLGDVYVIKVKECNNEC